MSRFLRLCSTHVLLATFLPLSRVVAQSPAVMIDHEAKHHLVFANDWVRVLDVIVPAGDSTLYHVHSNDYVFVTFGDVALKAQAQGAEKTDLVLANGEVRLTTAPITHRVLNPSSRQFHNLTIELLKASGAPLAPGTAGEVVLDNARVRVERIVLEPGQSSARHEHRTPGLDVGVSVGTVDVINTGGATDHVAYAPASYHWNGAPRTHTLTNVGRTRVEILEIEWK
jgi:hypothetical protein